MSPTLSLRRLFISSCIASSVMLTGCIGSDDDDTSGPTYRGFVPEFSDFELKGNTLKSVFFIPGKNYVAQDLDFTAQLDEGDAIDSIYWEQTAGEYDLDIQYADTENAYFSTQLLSDGSSYAYEFKVTVETKLGKKSQAQSRFILTKTFDASSQPSIYAGNDRTLKRTADPDNNKIDLSAVVFVPEPATNPYSAIEWTGVTDGGIPIVINEPKQLTATVDMPTNASQAIFTVTATFQNGTVKSDVVVYNLVQ